MKIAFKILALLLTFIIASCAMYTPPSDIREQFTNCYSGEKSGVESKLNIDGLHRIQMLTEYENEKHIGRILDTAYIDMVFYPEGSFLHGYKAGYYWGVYSISGDTIRTQFIDRPHPTTNTWYAFEDTYLVVDKNTVQLLEPSFRPLYSSAEKDKNKILRKAGIKKRVFSPGVFIKKDSLPDQNSSWLKNQSWVWCNENKYDHWKSSLKAGK